MNFLNYHHLFYFWSVNKEGGFTKASQKLRVSQSAVSEQVRQLEEALGQKLIDRTTRSLRLTENGYVAFRYAETIFGAGQELLDFMHHRPKEGKQLLRIGALGSLSRNLQLKFLEPILARKDVRFSLIVGDSKRLFRLLQDHQVDVVLSTQLAGEIEGRGFYTHLLMQSPLCLVSRSPLRKKNLRDSLQSGRIFLPSASLESRSEFDHYLEAHQISIHLAGEVDDVALLRLLALNGRGLVVIPRMGVLSDVQSKKLHVIHEFETITQKYYAITRQKRFPNELIRDLVQKVREL
ncbi:MAG: LysR family transcriptional regulator [Bdellovibrionia bacterium]